MTESRFEELINLYLDNEIGRHELGELKRAVKGNLVQRRKFERACQLHQAASKALSGSRANPASSSASATGKVSAPRPPRAATRGLAGKTSGAPRPRVSAVSTFSELKQKQTDALRNATIPVLAERQLVRGAAATMDIGGRRAATRDVPANIPFFHSTFGVWAGIVLVLFGLGALFVAFNHKSSDAFAGLDSNARLSMLARPARPNLKSMPGQLTDAKGNPLSPEDSMHARFYDNAMASDDAVLSSLQVNNLVLHNDAAKGGNGTEALSMHLTENTFVSPAQIGAGASNMTQAEVSWPAPTTISTNTTTSLLVPAPPIAPAPGNSTTPSSNGSPASGGPVLP